MISESTMPNLFQKTAENLAEHGNIEKQYIKLYAKAMEVALAIGINLVVALAVGYCFGMLWHCIVFLIAFIPLRSYAGGYHAQGYVTCFMQSVALLILVLAVIKYIALEGFLLSSIWQLFMISVAVIVICAPLADENKPISKREMLFFGKRARIIVVIETVVVLILNWLQVVYSYAVIMAVILSAFSLVLYACVIALKSA